MHTGYAVYVFVYQSLLTLHAVPEPMRTILLIEYEYVRMYIHSLPLQAFVERAVASTPSKHNLDAFVPNGNGRNDSVANGNEGIKPEDVRKWMQEDGPYISTLVESCQNVLALIGESKIPQEKLKHFTVRVYFRVMASAVHLLKVRNIFSSFPLSSTPLQINSQDYSITVHDYCGRADPFAKSFVVGAYAENITRSFELLGKATEVFQNRIVDDVHIGRTFAEMITTVSTQIYKRLTRFQTSSGVGRSRAVSTTPAVMHSPAPGAVNGTHNLPTSSDFSHMYGQSIPTGTGMDQFSMWTNNPEALLANLDDYDPSKTAMPPPRPFTGDDGGNDGMVTPLGNGMNPWITLDLHPLMTMAANGENYGVSSGHFGPTFEGGGDLLDPFMPDMAAMNTQHMHGLPGLFGNGHRVNGF